MHLPTSVRDIEKRLWDSADQLRANSKLKASEYSVPVLGLIFLRFADHTFEAAAQQLKEQQAPDGATPRRRALDLDALKARFEQGRKHTATQQLRGAITSRLTRMVRLNRSRADYLDRFQRLIDDYNSGAVPVEELFTRLVALAHQLDAEEQRTIAESLSEEELALFDLLTKPEPVLAEDDSALVKRAARDLLATLKREKLVLDWRKRQQSRAQVLTTIETLLDQELPRAYTPDIYQHKCDAVYQHVYDSYYGQGKSIYGTYGSAA